MKIIDESDPIRYLPVRTDTWPNGLQVKLLEQSRYLEENWDLICAMNKHPLQNKRINMKFKIYTSDTKYYICNLDVPSIDYFLQQLNQSLKDRQFVILGDDLLINPANIYSIELVE